MVVCWWYGAHPPASWREALITPSGHPGSCSRQASLSSAGAAARKLAVLEGAAAAFCDVRREAPSHRVGGAAGLEWRRRLSGSRG